ncbi:hypothetical protein TNCV_1478271 [Trichonephila clavipes]|nr:hypothetical protein TNCV_1478271 [Trichonephila clavipes]
MPLRRNRRQYEQLTDFDKKKKQGWSNRRIGRHLGRSDMVKTGVYRRGGHPVPSRETIRRRLTEFEEPTSTKTLTTDPTS